jgi:transcriptional regulator with XRE-family HTH domain
VQTLTWRVDELARRHGWTARQLAETTGLDAKTVRNILAGRATRVDLDTIARLSEALGVAPGALWRVEPDRRDAWERTAGAAGAGQDDDLREALDGAWQESPDPALERATRPS